MLIIIIVIVIVVEANNLNTIKFVIFVQQNFLEFTPRCHTFPPFAIARWIY